TVAWTSCPRRRISSRAGGTPTPRENSAANSVQFHTSTSPPCFFSLMIFATSSACLRVRQRMRNSFLPCFPFQTAYDPPTPIATRTLPRFLGMAYLAIFPRRLRSTYLLVRNALCTAQKCSRRLLIARVDIDVVIRHMTDDTCVADGFAVLDRTLNPARH